MNNSFLLLKTLLLSTSRRNILRYSKDPKKRRQAAGGYFGTGIVYLLITGFCVLISFAYGKAGLIQAVPEMCALVVSVTAFFFTFFKTNGYLFNFREYDMLLSLPFASHTVAACKFLYMYISSLPWYLSITLAMMIGYGRFVHPGPGLYLLWLLMAFLLPLIPMLLASFFGFLIAKIGAGLRLTNILQMVLSFGFVILCFFFRYALQDRFYGEQLHSTMKEVSGISGSISRFYLPARWFAEGINEGKLLSIALFLLLTLSLFAGIFFLVGKSYRNINSALAASAASRRKRRSTQKKRGVVQAIAFKEWKRMLGSTLYLYNGAMGAVLATILALLNIFLGFDKIVSVVLQGDILEAAKIRPAIPWVVYFFVGMVPTTVFSLSLEGKNFWILQSLPVEMRDVCRGKMLFHLYLSLPVMIIAELCICLSAKTPPLEMLLYLVLGAALCAFSTAWGMVIGTSHLRLNWENEAEVIKQGSAIPLYMFPDMFMGMALMVGVVALNFIWSPVPVTAILILLFSILSILSYRRVMTLARRI